MDTARRVPRLLVTMTFGLTLKQRTALGTLLGVGRAADWVECEAWIRAFVNAALDELEAPEPSEPVTPPVRIKKRKG